MPRLPIDHLRDEVNYLRFRGYQIDGKTEGEQREQCILAYLDLIREDAASKARVQAEAGSSSRPVGATE